MLLEVPLLPDHEWVQFINGRATGIRSVYFSLESPRSLDARLGLRRGGASGLIPFLSALHGPRRYALLNARFVPTEACFDRDFLHNVIRELDALLEEGLVDGVVAVDFYLLGALGRISPEVCRNLEAVPGINARIDSPARFRTVMEAVDTSGFRPPTKVTPDRSLNRRPDKLRELAAAVRRDCPEMHIQLLANEGCLDECPYRETHEAQIAAANWYGSAGLYEANRDYGCVGVLAQRPHRLLASPFIRPEDQGRYRGLADGLKICGRTLGPGFLERVVVAYLAGEYRGNLLDLLDSPNRMAESLFIPNHELPPDFATRVEECSRGCRNCGYCPGLLERLAKASPPTLPKLSHST